MARQPAVEFANFICTFGREKVLLDLAEEVILPALTSSELARNFGDTSYFFYQTEIIELSDGHDPVLSVAGRFVKNTLLEREQVFEEKRGLVRDHKSLRSAPSAIFVLILNNHKLLYLHETSDAPNLNAFRATTEKFARQKHNEFIDRMYKERKEGAKDAVRSGKITKKTLREEYPPPSIEIIPLSSDATLAEFIKQYSILKTVRAVLVETNNEIDMNDFFSKMRESKDDIGSTKTSLIHHNTKGLSKEKALTQLSAAAGQGNALIKLDGKDASGDTLRGNNESFKIRAPIDSVKEGIPAATKQMYKTFQELVKAGTVRVQEVGQKQIDKVRQIRDRLRKRNG